MAHEKGPPLSSQNSPEHWHLLRILASAFSGFLFGLFLSKFSTPHDNPRKAVQQEDTPKPEGQRSEAWSRGPLIIHSPVDPNKTSEKGNYKTPFWEKAAVVVALGLLVVNYFQMCSTKKAANAAKDAAKTASETLKSSNLSNWRSQRAWVVSSAPETQTFTGPVAINIEIDNIGITEAKKVTGFATLTILKKGENIDLTKKRWKTNFRANILVPRFHKTVRLGAFKDNPKVRQEVLAADIAKGLNEGTTFLMYYGSLTYIDTWNVDHWIRFCDFAGNYDVGHVDACVDYGDTDNNEPKQP